MKQVIVYGLFLMLAISGCAAQKPADRHRALQLWKGSTPGALGNQDTDKPTLTAYLPDVSKNTGTAVVICPGGGYVRLSSEHEGKVIAQWLREKGISAFVLKYRLPADGYRHPIPLMDAQHAIRLVRSRATEWHIDPGKIGIMGFSAGGHLASTAGTHFQQPVKIQDQESDEIDAVSCRPDFMVLVYPVISMQDDITHPGSRANLLGEHPARELLDSLSNEKQITQDTPPTFLIHANDDKSVAPENSIRFYEGLRKAGVPAEMHIYLKGGHGFGIRPSAGPARQWLHQCFLWMQQTGLISNSPGEKEDL